MRYTTRRIPIQTDFMVIPHTKKKGSKVYHVEAQVATCGLAYHAGIGSDKGIMVTHVASGIAIGAPLPTEQIARRAIEILAPILDWKQSVDELWDYVVSGPILKQIREALEQAHLVQGSLFES